MNLYTYRNFIIPLHSNFLMNDNKITNQKEFNNWFNDAEKKDDKVFEHFEKALPKIITLTTEYEHKRVMNALYQFMLSLGLLKNAIFDLVDSDNLYAVKANYRIYLEHWLRGIYIFTRYSLEQNEDVGKEFYSLLRISELEKYGDSVFVISEMLEIDREYENIQEFLNKFVPEISKIDRSHISDAVKNFQYKNIINYIRENKGPGNKWVHLIISDYSELSSYVHGGATAAEDYVALRDDRFEEYHGMLRFTFNMWKVFIFTVVALLMSDSDLSDDKDILKLFELTGSEDLNIE